MTAENTSVAQGGLAAKDVGFATNDAAAERPATLELEFSGNRLRVFWLLIWTAVVTVATLGIYRFWARSRVRRYIWSSASAGGQGLEYNGTGLEKFMGFSIAVVILAVYLAIAQILVTFVGFSLLGQFDPAQSDTSVVNEPGVFDLMIWGSTFLLLLPAITFAQYRAARYTAARTRWRGIRFAMDAAAKSYMWRASLLWLLTILTLGLFYPIQKIWLEKFRINRLSFGQSRFEQTGRWHLLIRPFLPMVICMVMFFSLFVTAINTIAEYFGPSLFLEGLEENSNQFAAYMGLTFLALCFLPLFGMAHARAHGFRRLVNARLFNGAEIAVCTARVWRVFGYYLAATMVCAVVIVAFLAGIAILAEVAGFEDIGERFFEIVGGEGAREVTSRWVFFAASLLYLLMLLLISAAWTAFAQVPTLAYLLRSTKVLQVTNLADTQQRTGDQIVDADGMADALDFGGGF